MINNSLIKILFFGKKNDKYSVDSFNFLIKNNFKVKPIWSTGIRNENLSKKIGTWKGQYIIFFNSYFILKKNILNKASIASINFHPSTPKYPGSGGAAWALLNYDKFYGVTVHFMNEKIDRGQIIDVKYFPINKKDDLGRLLNKTKKIHFLLFKKIIKLIKKDNLMSINKISKKNKKIKWHKKTYKIKELDKLQLIKLKLLNKDLVKLNKIIQSTNIGNFKPILVIDKHKFKLINN